MFSEKLHNIFPLNLISTHTNTEAIVSMIIPIRIKHVIGFSNAIVLQRQRDLRKHAQSFLVKTFLKSFENRNLQTFLVKQFHEDLR